MSVTSDLSLWELHLLFVPLLVGINDVWDRGPGRVTRDHRLVRDTRVEVRMGALSDLGYWDVTSTRERDRGLVGGTGV